VGEKKEGVIGNDELTKLWEGKCRTPKDDSKARNRIHDNFRPRRNRAVSDTNDLQVPQIVRDQIALDRMIGAIDRLRPDGGFSLGSYITRSLYPRGLSSPPDIAKSVQQYSDDGKNSTSERAKSSTPARQFSKEVKSEHGSHPSDTERAEHLKVSKEEIKKLRHNLQNTYTREFQIDDTFEVPDVLDMDTRAAIRTVHGSLTGRDREIMRLIYYPHLGGPEGPSLDKDIAMKVNLSPGMVSTIRKRIANLVSEALK